MSRRRKGIFSRLLDGLDYAWRYTLSWVLWPLYATLDVIHTLFSGPGGAVGRRSWTELLLDVLLFIPRWIGFFFLWLWQTIAMWPRMMRLRDLASGLPALLAAAAAVAVLFFFDRNEDGLLSLYEGKSNGAYEKLRQPTDKAEHERDLKNAQFYFRALVKLKPTDVNYRFNVACIYQEMGEHNRAQAIMDGLAPRDRLGFARAHYWQAEQLMGPGQPITNDTLKAAEAHYTFALATHSDPQLIHRRLGELYYYRYRRYMSREADPYVPSRDIYLAKAEEHLSQVAAVDTTLALTLAEIHGLQGRVEQAVLDVQTAITRLTARMADAPDDLESRLQLARAYRMIHQFPEAVNVLREGRNLSPNPRLDQELSTVYFSLSNDLRRRRPNSLPEQFAALQDAYRANPTNNFVAHRFIQAITTPAGTSASAEEVEFARSALQNLVDNRTPGQLAALLLGYDCLQRALPSKAEEYFRTLRAAPPDGTPEVIAGLTAAVVTGQVKSVNSTAVYALFEASLRVWPDHPDLLAARAQKNIAAKDFSRALGDLLKALERRPRDARLHEMIAVTYQQLGQIAQSKKHQELAASSRASTTPPVP